MFLIGYGAVAGQRSKRNLKTPVKICTVEHYIPGREKPPHYYMY
jgi:hypothetical protein